MHDIEARMIRNLYSFGNTKNAKLFTNIKEFPGLNGPRKPAGDVTKFARGTLTKAS